jgi:hypothetical protein
MKFSSVLLLLAAVSSVEANNLNQITLRRNLATKAECDTFKADDAKCVTAKDTTSADCKKAIAGNK